MQANISQIELNVSSAKNDSILLDVAQQSEHDRKVAAAAVAAARLDWERQQLQQQHHQSPNVLKQPSKQLASPVGVQLGMLSELEPLIRVFFGILFM